MILIERARLSGAQIREAFLAYFSGPRAAFPPQPGEIVALVPEQQQREDQTLREMRELKKRAASGEQFFGIRDVFAAVGIAEIQAAKPMPAGAQPAHAPSPEQKFAGFDMNRNAEKLRQQKRELLSQTGMGRAGNSRKPKN